MNPFVSQQEGAIRQAVVAKVHEIMPGANIIHELVVDDCRADLAAVDEDRLILFELKSSRDTLHRLRRQIRYFFPACHGLVVVADEKWCGRATEAGYPNCDVRKILEASGTTAHLWQYPEPQAAFPVWRIPARIHYPWAWKMLRILWIDELKAVCSDRRITYPTRTNRSVLIDIILRRLTGWEIERAVCAALRSRRLADADLASGVAA